MRPMYASFEDMQADLVGTFEIAANLGETQENVKQWVRRRESTLCPAPIVALRRGAIYSLAEWQAWYAVWRVTRGADTWWMNEGKS